MAIFNMAIFNMAIFNMAKSSKCKITLSNCLWITHLLDYSLSNFYSFLT
nr:MAG TPA: hypothetical protein [Caudoviricetes sp.]